MGQDKVKMTHKVKYHDASWLCAIVGNKFYVEEFCNNDVLGECSVFTTYKSSVEEVYKGRDGYVVKKINSFKGNV